LTPWKSSSRTASRRSELPRLLPLPLLLLLALAALPAAGQGLSLSVSREGPLVRAGVVFRWDREQELFSTLREGLESRITFTLRAFEKSPGLLSLLGDRLLAEKTVARSAYFNFLDNTYVVEEADGARAAYTDLGALLKGFFSVPSASLLVLGSARRGPCYVTARAQFDPVRLMPPLTIVSLAGAAATTTTPWVRAEIPR
jgi:hypothetical protein